MKKLTTEQAVVISAYTEILICNFSDLQKAVEDKLGRPVWTHEFADKETVKKIKEAFKDDFLSMSPVEEKAL